MRWCEGLVKEWRISQKQYNPHLEDRFWLKPLEGPAKCLSYEPNYGTISGKPNQDNHHVAQWCESGRSHP